MVRKFIERPDRVPMPQQDPQQRIHNFDEVALGYSHDEARREASRCLQCPRPTCENGCPVGVHIKAFIAALNADDLPRAVALLKERNALPAVCGRVCPQESQCEKTCILARKGQPVAIGRLERYLADWDRALPPEQRNATAHAPKKQCCVAVVGSGPASLACAGELSLRGFKVEVFEALHTAGGVLAYGIPQFRLPKDILADEIDSLRHARVRFRFDELVGRTTTAAEMLAGHYCAVFLGLGAGLPRFMDIPGEAAAGVYSANEYLTRVNLMHAADFPEWDTPIYTGNHVCVVGGGNVAMDAARTARRLGATRVTVAYRRTRAQMPARAEEVEHARDEGIELVELVAPIRVCVTDGRVSGMRVQRMELGEPDASGRRRPVPVSGEDAEYEIDCDTVITAIGTRPNPHISEIAPVERDERGYISTDADGRTSVAGVYAGGDAVTGAATVILAMGAGKRAAAAIDHDMRT
ncbi:MAG: NADPH-dependent glutamate synthase [Actinomycetes bacterium]|jgi:glutamate synthase (NADPH/NADH) small chain|nr:NADPH-dependent glutamate synthase [Actinomycetes bacterium]